MQAVDALMDLNMQALGEKLFQARHTTGLTQRAVATMIGVDISHYNQLEKGRLHNIGAKTLYKLCQVFTLSADDVLGLSQPPAGEG